MEPSHYVGLDVSQELTSICVIDGGVARTVRAAVKISSRPVPRRAAPDATAPSENVAACAGAQDGLRGGRRGRDARAGIAPLS
jgi:hypothetical protein